MKSAIISSSKMAKVGNFREKQMVLIYMKQIIVHTARKRKINFSYASVDNSKKKRG